MGRALRTRSPQAHPCPVRGDRQQVVVTQPAAAAGWVENSNLQLAPHTPAHPLAALSFPSKAAPHFHTPLKERKCLSALPNTSSASFHIHTCGQTLKMPTRRHFAVSHNTFNYLQRLQNGSVPDHTYRFLTARASHSPTRSTLSRRLRPRPRKCVPAKPPQVASGSQSGSPPALLRNTLAARNYSSQHPPGRGP
ncbi:hypothetical protein STEG23_001027 [Scotinomys teguina]